MSFHIIEKVRNQLNALVLKLLDNSELKVKLNLIFFCSYLAKIPTQQ